MVGSMHESPVSRSLRRWGERVILSAMVLVGFGIGTAGLALVGERWQDDPVVLDDPAPLPTVGEPTMTDEPVMELALGAEPVAAPESIVVEVETEVDVEVDPDPEPGPEALAERDRRRDGRDRDRRRGTRRR